MDQDNDDATSGERQISYHFAVALNLAQLHSDQVIQHTSIDSALEAAGGNTKQSKNWKTRYNWPRRSRDFSRNVNVNNLTLRISADSTRISVSEEESIVMGLCSSAGEWIDIFFYLGLIPCHLAAGTQLIPDLPSSPVLEQPIG